MVSSQDVNSIRVMAFRKALTAESDGLLMPVGGLIRQTSVVGEHRATWAAIRARSSLLPRVRNIPRVPSYLVAFRGATVMPSMDANGWQNSDGRVDEGVEGRELGDGTLEGHRELPDGDLDGEEAGLGEDVQSVGGGCAY
jgi:hypothetical protein